MFVAGMLLLLYSYIIQGFYHYIICRNHRNVIEAAADGAWMSISLVANTAANLIAFLALLAFTNSTLQWFGAFVGLPQLTFEVSERKIIAKYS